MARETEAGKYLEHKVRSEIRKYEGRLPRNVAASLKGRLTELRKRDHAHKRDAFNIEAEINRYTG